MRGGWFGRDAISPLKEDNSSAQSFNPDLYTQVDMSSKAAYREAVRDRSPGLLGLGFCHKELALKGRPNAMVFLMDRKVFIFIPSGGHPFRANFGGAFPGLKAWAVLLNRFAVRSNSGEGLSGALP